jgi:hypothetical protein
VRSLFLSMSEFLLQLAEELVGNTVACSPGKELLALCWADVDNSFVFIDGIERHQSDQVCIHHQHQCECIFITVATHTLAVATSSRISKNPRFRPSGVLWIER